MDLLEIPRISKLDYQLVCPIELHDQFDQMIVRLDLVLSTRTIINKIHKPISKFTFNCSSYEWFDNGRIKLANLEKKSKRKSNFKIINKRFTFHIDFLVLRLQRMV